MSFPQSSRNRLFDRIRGKVGADLMNDLESAFFEDFNRPDRSHRSMFFDLPPQRSPQFRRQHRGFPFDDEPDHSSFFNDPLHEPPWSEEKPPLRKRGPGSSQQPTEQNSTASSVEPSEQLPTDLNQHGLRNTVPLATENKEDSEGENRQQRSMSAPPDGNVRQPRRYITKCEIPPGVGDPEVVQKQQKQQQQSSNVRVIPIQVEGRSEPVINTKLASNMDTATHFGDSPAPAFDGRLPRDFGSYQKHSPRFQSQPQQHHQQQQPQQQQQQQQQQPPQPQYKPPTSKASTINQEQPSTPSQQQQQQQQLQPNPSDPIVKVAKVQAEVEELAKQVESCRATSRKDKNYLYLDEMLTRELIKLDDIETEGKEEIRNARKNAIRSIQRCISLLESKVQDLDQPMDVDDHVENKLKDEEMKESDLKENKSNDQEMKGNDQQETKPNDQEMVVNEQQEQKPKDEEMKVAEQENKLNDQEMKDEKTEQPQVKNVENPNQVIDNDKVNENAKSA